MKNNIHTGNRKRRGEKIIPHRLGHYLIITDTEETENNYFTGIKNILPGDVRDNIVIKVVKAKTEKLVETAKECRSREAQFYQVWIVFDRDQVNSFDKIVCDAEKNGIAVGWSNPCFEIWLAAYFGVMPNWIDSVQCCNEFKKLFKKKLVKIILKTQRQYIKIW